MFAVLNKKINVSKCIYEYKTAEIDELSKYNKVKVNLYNKQCLQFLS